MECVRLTKESFNCICCVQAPNVMISFLELTHRSLLMVKPGTPFLSFNRQCTSISFPTTFSSLYKISRRLSFYLVRKRSIVNAVADSRHPPIFYLNLFTCWWALSQVSTVISSTDGLSTLSKKQISYGGRTDLCCLLWRIRLPSDIPHPKQAAEQQHRRRHSPESESNDR